MDGRAAAAVPDGNACLMGGPCGFSCNYSVEEEEDPRKFNSSAAQPLTIQPRVAKSKETLQGNSSGRCGHSTIPLLVKVPLDREVSGRD